MDCIQFEAKGTHDHPRPEAKKTLTRKKGGHAKCNYSMEDNLVGGEDLKFNVGMNEWVFSVLCA